MNKTVDDESIESVDEDALNMTVVEDPIDLTSEKDVEISEPVVEESVSSQTPLDLTMKVD